MTLNDNPVVVTLSLSKDILEMIPYLIEIYICMLITVHDFGKAIVWAQMRECEVVSFYI